MMTVGRAKGDSQDPHAPAAEGPGGNGDFVKHVQKLVNNVRRAEQKMRKQVAEQQQTDEKWAQFQKELKTAFMKERTKYKDRMDRLLKEKEEARAAQENAVEELYKMLADPQAYIQAPTDTEPAQDAQPGRLAPADGEARGGCRHGAGWGIQGAGDEGPSPAANVGDSPQKGGQSTSDDTASHGREPTRTTRSRSQATRTPIKAQGRKPVSAPSQATSLASKLEATRAAMLEAANAEVDDMDDEDFLIGNLRSASGPPPPVEID
eukprot:s4703_g7.t1